MVDERQKKELLKRFKEFVGELSGSDRICVVYDNDPDGICAGVVASKAIERLTKVKPVAFVKGHAKSYLTDEDLEKFKKEKIDKLIAVDLGITEKIPPVIEAEKFLKRILVLDHHQADSDFESEKTLVIKTQSISDLNSARYPASKLAYDLFSEFVDLEDEKWVVCVGLLGDYALASWKPFFKKTFKELGISWTQGLDLCKEIIKLCGGVGMMAPEKLPDFFEAVYNARCFDEVRRKDFIEMKEIIDGEMKRLFNAAKESAEIIEEKKVVFLEVKSKYPIKSVLINKVSTEIFKDYSVVACSEENGSFKISLRRQDCKFDMGRLTKLCIEGMDATGGGHIPAAGCVILKKDLKLFKERVLENISNCASAGDTPVPEDNLI